MIKVSVLCGAGFPHVISVVGVIHGHRHPRGWLERA